MLFPVHTIQLRDMGLTQGQNFDLEALAAHCAADGVLRDAARGQPRAGHRRHRRAREPRRHQVGHRPWTPARRPASTSPTCGRWPPTPWATGSPSWWATSAAPTPTSRRGPTASPTTSWIEGVGPGQHVGPLPRELPRVPRGHAGLLQDPGRPDQRELPLRRRRAALPARQLRRRRRDPRSPARRRAGGGAPRPRPRARGPSRPAPPYEAALAASSPDRPAGARTAATTTATSSTRAAPPGCRRASCGGRATPSSPASAAATRCASRARSASPAELPERIGDGITYLPLAPMMHAAAQWTSFMWFFCGGKVVLMEGSLDPGQGVAHHRGGGRQPRSRSSGTRSPSRSSTRGMRWTEDERPDRLDAVLDLQRRRPDVHGLQGPHPRSLPEPDGQRRLRLVGGGHPGLVPR